MKITRDFYRPKADSGYIKYTLDNSELKDCDGYKEGMFEAWIKFGEKPSAIFFTGKRAKPTWQFRFPTEKRMQEKITESIEALLAREVRKQERKKEAAEKLDNIKVGDLFVSSWGYDQTNVDFYQCTAKKGKTMTFSPIACETVEDSTISHGMADDVRAKKGAFLADKERYPVLVKRSLKISSFQWMRPTTESKSHYRSWYA